MYKCKECGKGVIIIKDEKPIKQCKCNAPIICDMSASAQGQGGIKG